MLGLALSFVLVTVPSPDQYFEPLVNVDQRPLQVAVIIDQSAFGTQTSTRSILPTGALIDLALFEQVVFRSRPGVRFGLGVCRLVRDQPRLRVVREFARRPSAGGSETVGMLTGMTSPHPDCAGRVDVLDEALQRFRWDRRVQRHLLLVTGDGATFTGRRTLTDFAADAEHNGLIVHALVISSGDAPASATALRAVVDGFRQHPTWPKVVPGLRGVTLRSGGAHVVTTHVGAQWEGKDLSLQRCRDLWNQTRREARRRPDRRGAGLTDEPAGDFERFEERLDRDVLQTAATEGCPYDVGLLLGDAFEEERAALGLTDAYGRRDDAGLDVLNRLVAGNLRSDQVRADDRPRFLVGVALEPLLDHLHDFVDARDELEELAKKRAFWRVSDGKRLPIGGWVLASAVIRGAHLPPSRR